MAVLIAKQLRMDSKPRDEYRQLKRKLRRKMMSKSDPYTQRYIHSSDIVSDELVEQLLQIMIRELMGTKQKAISETKKSISASELTELQEKSRKRALELRSKLGLTDDPMQIDGFQEIKGILKPYSRPSEDAVELLNETREEVPEEKD
jgi:hypothetical protein